MCVSCNNSTLGVKPSTYKFLKLEQYSSHKLKSQQRFNIFSCKLYALFLYPFHWLYLLEFIILHYNKNMNWSTHTHTCIYIDVHTQNMYGPIDNVI